MRTTPKPPEILDKIVDMVLAHRPKPKSKAVKKRKKAEACLILAVSMSRSIYLSPQYA
jgi:hypothetical protein